MSESEWTVSADKPWCIVDESGAVIATVSTNCAAMMVREHNAHGALVDALRDARSMLERVEVENSHPGDPWSSALKRIDAALSQARA